METKSRKHPRLVGYDYSQNGAYFVTICIKNMQQILWSPPVGARIARPPGDATLSNIGRIVNDAILKIPEKYDCVTLDKYVIMPNHIHLLLTISAESGRAMRAPTLSTVINQFKGYATKQIGYSIWQKLFYDHVIRSEATYLKAWQYIDNNPAKWQDDEYYAPNNH